MKIKVLLLNVAVILFFIGCSNSSTQKIQVGDTIKVSSQFDASGNEDIIYVWSPPISSNSSVPQFEIKDDIIYFSVSEIGSYNILLSIKTREGENIVEESFGFTAIEFINKDEKTYKSAVFPSIGKQKKIETSLPHFTVQLYSRTIKKEALKDSSMIYDFGFEDVYIEEFKKDATLYWRVRTGNFNSIIKAEKHKKKLSEVLEININKIWALEIK